MKPRNSSLTVAPRSRSCVAACATSASMSARVRAAVYPTITPTRMPMRARVGTDDTHSPPSMLPKLTFTGWFTPWKEAWMCSARLRSAS